MRNSPDPDRRTGNKPQEPSEDGMSKQSSDADVAFISALAELLNKNELTELSVKREYGEDDSLEVKVVKQANIVTTAVAAPAPVYAAAPAAAPVAAAAAAPAIKSRSARKSMVPPQFKMNSITRRSRTRPSPATTCTRRNSCPRSWARIACCSKSTGSTARR